MLHHKGLVHIAEVLWTTLSEIGRMLEQEVLVFLQLFLLVALEFLSVLKAVPPAGLAKGFKKGPFFHLVLFLPDPLDHG